MSALADAAQTPQTQRLTYPISPEYVRAWNSERAIAELVANALDEDPEFTYEWSDGVLSIEDGAHGIGDGGLVLGISTKTIDNIGQWGEGTKIAMLVLARDRAIGAVHVETVGYSFTPLITRQRLVTVGGQSGRELPELLAFDLVANDRRRGTRITIECSQRLAEKVRRRFRHFETGYTPAPEHGQVLDGPAGRLYIGGVLVSENRKRLLFSYDFSLAQAKGAQNRDRSVIDAQLTDQLIRSALANMTDPALLERWVDAALAGTLSEAEQCFASHPIPGQRKALRAIAKRRWGGRLVCYTDAHQDPEAVLYCRERDYLIIEDKLGRWSFANLMAAMGVSAASKLYSEPQREQTDWCADAELSADERATLALAVRIIRSVHGQDAIGRCDVYERTSVQGADTDLAWGGFFDPTDAQRIGVHRENLKELAQTVRVLGHEAAHRLRYRSSRYNYADNSRGFESQLDGMLADALMALHESGQIDVLQARRAQEADSARLKAAREREARKARELTHPAGIIRAVLLERMAGSGLSAQALADEAGVSVHCIRKMTVGARRNGYRECPAPKLQRTGAVCEALGLDDAVVHLALLSEAGIVGEPYQARGLTYYSGFSRRGRHMHNPSDGDGRIMGVRGDEAQACIAALRERGFSPAALDAIDAQVQKPFDTSGESWMEPYRQLISDMLARPACS